MNFTVDVGPQLLREYRQFDADQKRCLGEFVSLVKAHGLDQTKLPGKLSPSWLNAGQSNFTYAQQHDLWHYHSGYPQFRFNGPGKPHTSDWVIHFQWVRGSTHIDVLDFYTHYNASQQFYLPSAGRLPPAKPQRPDDSSP